MVRPSPQPPRHVPAAAGRPLRTGRRGALFPRHALPVAPAHHLRRQFHGRRDRQDAARHLSVRALKAAGHEPAALTRGYGGRLSGPYWVNATTDVARDVGDEALLLAKAAPTLVARDRRLGARAIEIGPHPVTVDRHGRRPAEPRVGQGPGDRRRRRRARSRQRPGDAGRPAAGASRVPARADGRHRRQRECRRRGRGRPRDGMAAPSLRRPRAARERRRRRGHRLAQGRARRRLGRHRRAAALLCDAAGAGRGRGGGRRLPRSSAARRGRRPAPAGPGAAAFGHAGHDAEGHGPPRRRPRACAASSGEPRACFPCGSPWPSRMPSA